MRGVQNSQGLANADPSGAAVLENILGPNALVGVCLLLGLVAVVAVIGVVMARRETRLAARIARSRTHGMSELLRTVRMAESIAELGVWQYDPASGRQQWSKGMRSLFGIDHDDPFVDGDAETLLLASEMGLIDRVTEHRNTREPFEMDFDVLGCDGIARSISVQACNLPNRSGGVSRVVAVLRDVTNQVQRERRLEHSREVALSEAQRARQLAATDPLTGLANRRRVMVALDKAIVQARRHSQPLSLIAFDIDHFKAVNDTFGHLVGDRVLRRLAEIALAQVRESDLVGRVGGEEFVWIVPGADENFTRIMAERLRQAIASGSAVGDSPAVTASVGFAELMQDDTGLTLFARADKALYEAKESGRNRVRMAA
ncbi:MAG: GGDEF domain-containing protein [Erythrobacter sp.]|nr:GGDEF domain-containing protein [Erythrobacter sp.]